MLDVERDMRGSFTRCSRDGPRAGAVWNCTDIVPGLMVDQLVDAGLTSPAVGYAACPRAILKDVKSRDPASGGLTIKESSHGGTLAVVFARGWPRRRCS